MCYLCGYTLAACLCTVADYDLAEEALTVTRPSLADVPAYPVPVAQPEDHPGPHVW